ncbi:cysteine hydrolase family protein [Ascidiaceihabitans sp.]|uniref:cysteine hydrolase family protein n=1 Tax=Ascidiaceihabitans sp. TaxID=1872644 RepID=UPI0032987D9E
MTRTALLLVDIQNDYFEGGLWPLHQMDRVTHTAAAILAKARKTGRQVIHVLHEGASDAPFFRPGTQGAKIHDSVAPVSGETVVLKHRPNSFHETELLDILRKTGVTRVQIIGAMAQMCIDATARAARDFGFEVEVVADAVAAKSVVWNGHNVSASDVHAAFMASLSGTYATVVPHAKEAS